MKQNNRFGQMTLQYSLMVFPVAFAGIPIYIFLPDYYHNHFGLSLTFLSFSLFILRILDALIDPLIGLYCDRFVRWHKISFLCIIGLFCLGFYMLCTPLLDALKINLLLGLFLATFCFSYLSIFINTLGALWKKAPEDKARIISTRECFNIFGILCASILPFALSTAYAPSTSYFILSITFITLILFAALFFLSWYKKSAIAEKFVAQKTTKPALIKPYFQNINRHGCFLFISYSISAFGSAIPAVMLVFYSRYVLQMPKFTGLYLFLYFLGTILAIPLIKKIALKQGIIKTWRHSIALAIIIFIGAYFLGPGDVLAFSIISFTSGLCFAAELLLPNLLVAKWIDHPKRKALGNGYYALLSFIAKSSLALATIASLPWLDQNLKIEQVLPDTVSLVKLLYCLMPCLIKAIAFIALLIWERTSTQGA